MQCAMLISIVINRIIPVIFVLLLIFIYLYSHMSIIYFPITSKSSVITTLSNKNLRLAIRYNITRYDKKPPA